MCRLHRSHGVALLMVTCAVVLAGCASGGGLGRTGGRADRLSAAGATFPYPLYSKWFYEYNRLPEHVQVNYQSIGSGGGIQQLKMRTVDIGASDAPLSDEELAAMPAPVEHLPTVAGAVALAYNVPGVAGGLKLTQRAVAGIFLGDIKRWDAPAIAQQNPEVRFPDLPILVTHRSDGSGTSYVFTHYLAAISPEWQARVGAGKSVAWPVGIGGKGNEGVTGLITQMEGAIGYVEMAYARGNKLAVAALENQAGRFITPSVAGTTAAARGAREALARDIRSPIMNSPDPEAYPIASFTYLLVYREIADKARGQTIAALLWWAIHEGQQYGADLDYAPLPPGVVQINEATIRRLTSGGKPLWLGPRPAGQSADERDEE